ncbi:hypothetical protein ACVW1A_000662 [Bradyrhizobium sp. LB1.3]
MTLIAHPSETPSSAAWVEPDAIHDGANIIHPLFE